jgi:hypothetical protein
MSKLYDILARTIARGGKQRVARPTDLRRRKAHFRSF